MAAEEQTVHTENYPDPPTETEARTTDNVHELADSLDRDRFKTHTEGLSRKIRERAGNRSTVTRRIAEAEYAIEIKNTNKLKRLRKTLTDKCQLLTEMDREIVKVILEDKLENEVEQSDMVRERIEDALMEIDEALEKLALPTHKKSTHRRSHHRREESTQSSSMSSSEQSSEEGFHNVSTTKTVTTSATPTLTSASVVMSSSAVTAASLSSSPITSTSTHVSRPRVSFTSAEPSIWSFNPSHSFSDSPSPLFPFRPATTTSTNTRLGSATAIPGTSPFAHDTPVSTMTTLPLITTSTVAPGTPLFTGNTPFSTMATRPLSTTSSSLSGAGEDYISTSTSQGTSEVPPIPSLYSQSYQPTYVPSPVLLSNPWTQASYPPPMSLSPTVSHVRLPKLSIKPFDGNATSWTTFWDSFSAAIHDSTNLTDIDKFNYLRSFLRGPAYESISGLLLTAANYKEAIEILKRRFGNKQMIVSRHMDALMSLEPVASTNNMVGLRRLYDSVETHIRGLESLGVGAETYGSLLSSVLLNKLPVGLRLATSRKLGSEEWGLNIILREF